MGCDIHMFVEKRAKSIWTSADQWTKCEDGVAVRWEDKFYTERNYDLFAILADVRNGRGFAGCDTGDGFVPICSPRGLPLDVSIEVKTESESWGCDGHSHSYLTVRELLNYDWTQRTRHRGWVNGPTLFEWMGWKEKNGEDPSCLSGDVCGGAIRKVTRKELETMIQGAIATVQGDRWGDQEKAVRRLTDHVYAQVEYTQPYYKSCRRFLSDAMPRLWRLGAAEDVRIVFWFDN